ncbi:hypothetical protein MLD38_031249 [Melastoma candidum]|uniref:Uncharacterized protein n=1 Tax=Melastoma candidum TaxID=119954 RepID=A0ACB9MNQ8_9MYRT|nr:hypothetical protein MLD38_031249 [Melastoma candidum]
MLSHSGTLKFMGKLTREKTKDALRKLLDEFSKRGTTFDLQDLFDWLSFDLICKFITGFDQKSLSIHLPGVTFTKHWTTWKKQYFIVTFSLNGPGRSRKCSGSEWRGSWKEPSRSWTLTWPNS